MSSTPKLPAGDLPPGAGLAYRLFAIIILIIIVNQVISIYVENLWFDSVGYRSVYWYRLAMQLGAFGVFAGATGIILWLTLGALRPRAGDSRSVLEFGGESIEIPPDEFFKRLGAMVALVFAFLFGMAYSIDWERYALFLNQPEPSGMVDPILGQDVNYYLFVLPALDSVAAWILAMSVIVAVAAGLFTALDRNSSFRGLSISTAVLAIALAARAYIYRFHLLSGEHPLFSGVTYADANAYLPGLTAIAVSLIVAAVIAAYNVQACRLRNLAIAVAVPALTYAVAWVLIPGYVTSFVVRPNELVRETPYITHAIEHTRRAFGLDAVEEIPFEPAVTDAVFDPDDHTQTLENLRLWDWRALQSTLQQVQEIRTYYDFVDVDVDRYEIDGEKRSMMLATRELNLTKLPSTSSNWINERLIFTHGYGVTMNPVNAFTSEGLPDLVLYDMPVESKIPSIRVDRPEIYFGEMTNWPVYVKTGQQEFNYPEGDSNNYSTYEGAGGIVIGSMVRRLILAYQTGELMTLPFADDVNSNSQLLMHRNIHQRVRRIAPFLIYDDDAYMVVGEDGGLYWIIDAFTVADTYPYSRQILFDRQLVNYIRNSVKVVVNAYDGDTRFFVFEPDDPVIQAYRNTFPGLFIDADEMPEFLRPHVRYPEFMFRTQALVYATYHVEDEQVFYNQEDLWTVAQQGRSQAGSDEIEPYFVLLRFPGEEEVEFVSILPFTPANRNNLIGWMAARSDGEAYGKLRGYRFPKTRFVDGPLQIEARIDQDPELSSQLSLWNQQGSTVLRGNLLVIPLDETLLFVAPIYLQAERSPMPELRIVVLATQDRMAYGATFDEALAALLNLPTTAPAPTDVQLTQTDGATTPVAVVSGPQGTAGLIERAGRALADYQRLTADGRLAEAGLKLQELKDTLDQLRSLPPR